MELLSVESELWTPLMKLLAYVKNQLNLSKDQIGTIIIYLNKEEKVVKFANWIQENLKENKINMSEEKLMEFLRKLE